MEQWYRAAGAIEVQRGGLGTMGPTTHAYGGTRMGDNPETNVVNRWGFSHEVPNLGILGASVMGTSGARNPTLTVQALAWRTADIWSRTGKVCRAENARTSLATKARRHEEEDPLLVFVTFVASWRVLTADSW